MGTDLLPRWLVVTQHHDGNLGGRMHTVSALTAAAAVKLIGQPPKGTHSAIAFRIDHGGIRIPLVIVEDHWQDDSEKWGRIA